jgi:hypothetical protein
MAIKWWDIHKKEFPILSELARDVNQSKSV